MEESKVKTVEEVTAELKILIRLLEVRSNTYNLFGKKHLAFEKSMLKNLHAAGIFVTDIDTQSHITKLEARNKELEEALLKAFIALKHTEYGLNKNSAQAVKLVEQALNKK